MFSGFCVCNYIFTFLFGRKYVCKRLFICPSDLRKFWVQTFAKKTRKQILNSRYAFMNAFKEFPVNRLKILLEKTVKIKVRKHLFIGGYLAKISVWSMDVVSALTFKAEASTGVMRELEKLVPDLEPHCNHYSRPICCLVCIFVK